MSNPLKGEPVLTTGTIIAVVAAGIALAANFGLNLSKDQIAAILGFLTVVAPVIAAVISRGYVTPVSSLLRGTVVLNPAPFDPTGGSTEPNTPISNLGGGVNPGNVLAPGGTTPLQPVFVPGNVVAPGGSIPLTQSFAGSSADQLSAPTVKSVVFTTTGGFLGSASVAVMYGYRLTTLNALGETGPGPEQGYMLGAATATQTITLNWTPDPAGTGTKVYGRTVGGEQLLATLGAGVGTWTDTGSVTPSGALPGLNTTGTPQVGVQGAVGGFGNVVAPGGSVPVTQGAWPIPGGGSGSAGQFTTTEEGK